MKQLLSGVKFLHQHKILHRDIKSANLLITKNNVLKIADWGLARIVYSPEQKLTNPVVTLWYRSPEVICGSRYYGNEVDIWSVG
jgi:serine/threonine protein kinase